MRAHTPSTAAALPTRFHRRRGFTILELLLVIAVVVLALSLLLPSITSGRTASRALVSAANLHQLGGQHLMYAADNADGFLNPFAATSPSGLGWALPLDDSGDPAARTLIAFTFATDNRYVGEAFAAYWYSYFLLRSPGATGSLRTFFSPQDVDGLGQYEHSRRERSEALLPGSYYYSPVFFKNPALFAAGTSGCASPYGPWYRANRCERGEDLPMTNRVSDVRLPAHKALLFERADFVRHRTSGLLPPAWNNPLAAPLVAMVDGSTMRADVGGLTGMVRQSLRDDSGLDLMPTDLLAVPDLFPPLGPGQAVALDLPGNRDGLFPLFFAATRHGLRGQDVMR